MTLLFLWVIILTIVCIALGSNIGKEHVLNFSLYIMAKYEMGKNILWQMGFGKSCSKSRLGMTLLFLWVIILTIVCIALGSNIGKEHVLYYFTYYGKI